MEGFPVTKTIESEVEENTQEGKLTPEELYEKELLPLIEILKPDDISIEEYEQQVVNDLFEGVKKQQIAQGKLIESEEETLRQEKEMLVSRIKAILEDARDYDRKEKPDPRFVSKAKIALLYERDYGDIHKYIRYDYEPEKTNIRDLRNYIIAYGDNNRFSESDLESLMKTDYRYSLIESSHSDYYGNYGACTTIPKSMLIALVESKVDNKYYQVSGALKNAEDGKYDRKTFEILCKSRYRLSALEFIDKFNEIDEESIYNSEKLIGDNIDQTLQYINDSDSILEINKERILKNIYKNYLSNGEFYNFYEITQKFDAFNEQEKQSEEIQNIALQGFKNFLPRGEHFFQIKKVLDYFKFPPEKLQTKEIKENAIRCLESRLLRFGYDSSVQDDCSQIKELFSISNEEFNNVIQNVIPKIAMKEPNVFLYFLSTYNLSEKEITSQELLKNINENILKATKNFDINALVNILENFPSIKNLYPEGSTGRDVIFYRFIHNKDLNLTEDQLRILKNIQESFWVEKKQREKLPQPIIEVLKRFEDQYGNKGSHLIALAISAYGTENSENFAAQMKFIEQVLNKYNPDMIPKNANVSMGIEYEVTNSIITQYNENSVLGYNKDIELVSESANIGKGTASPYEIATKPNYNPYMLLAETKLMQDAGFLDFNFENYSKAARGYHLSLVGDQGLYVDENMYFLNNVLTLGQLTGVIAGKEVRYTKDIHSKTFENFSNIHQNGERCEIKGMATDSIEQFEKAIITAHHAGIAIQLANKYVGDVIQFLVVPNTAQEFENMLITTSTLIEPFISDQERDIVYEWTKLKREIVDAIGQHNESFVDSEFNGYVLDKDGNYVDTAEHIDIVRNRKLMDENLLNSVEFKSKLHINVNDLFSTQTVEFINALTNTNNIFLKPPQGDDNSPVNANAVLNTVKQEGYSDILDGKAQESIFERGGVLRDGYYYTQGASEEMIIHKAQILLNQFNKSMEKHLSQKGVPRVLETDNLIAV